jgi:riboflavin kinase/FMN adenylyltransferase
VQLFRSLAEVPDPYGPSAVTIGKFDGVHAGHRAVIRQLLSEAEHRGLTATVVTFDRHPLALLNPAICPESLLSNEQKAERLAETGVHATLMLPFDRPFSEQSPEEFVEKVLVTGLDAKLVSVGSDFRYGAKGRGTVDSLIAAGQQFGFEVLLVDDVRASQGRRASSTWIREVLAQGDVAKAAELLGKPATVRSVVVPGEKRGRELGFPTANLKPQLEGLIPADGIYAGWLTVDGVTYPAAISVGNNPTFDGVPERQVEAYVLDEDIDLYGKTVEVSFAEYIRGMVKFDGIVPLIAQLENDVDSTRNLLGMPKL